MNESRPHLFGMLAGLFLAAGLVLSAMLGTAAWVKIKNSQFVTTKGSAQRNVESDLIVWHGSFTDEAETLLDAQRKVQAERARVADFLTGAGVTNFVFAPAGIEEMKATHKTPEGWVEQRTTGYRLTQRVSVESAEVDRVDKLDPTPLVEAGVLFTVEPPQFIYSQAGEAKLEMLADATRNARERAEHIAAQGGREIARLHNADQGIFQITAEHSSATSWEGENDTAARRKSITAVVTATFLLK
jgi:hypothetical protein